jgi:hypothetical protein
MSDGARSFVVARNPDSRPPYLLRLPLEGGLTLKAREPWPATARVYCHRFAGDWPKEAEIIEQTLVRLCLRRGAAIDLVLDRPLPVFDPYRPRALLRQQKWMAVR